MNQEIVRESCVSFTRCMVFPPRWFGWLEAYKEKDPVLLIQEKIVKEKIASQEEVNTVMEAINAEIDAGYV